MVSNMASKGTITGRELEQIARRVPEDIATEGNFDLIDEIFAEDCVEHGPMGEIHGRETFRTQLESFLGAFDDFSATVEDVVSAGDTVAMRVTLSGTHAGEFMGVEPTGESFEIANLVWTRIEDGRIVERWAIPDMMSFFRQLGVEELPAPPAS